MWKPDKTKVSDKEIVGRRVFGKKIFREPRERGLFVPDIFFDTRLENDLSFDRLGLKTVYKEVIKFLTPQCQQHGDMQNKKFVGWAAIKVSDIKKIKVSKLETLEIQPTPTQENPYHADLSREGFRDSVSAERLACQLAYYASILELVLPANEETSDG